MTILFNPGDIVRCVRDHDYSVRLTIGNLYKVDEMIFDGDEWFVRIKDNTGHTGGWEPNRFVLSDADLTKMEDFAQEYEEIMVAQEMLK